MKTSEIRRMAYNHGLLTVPWKLATDNRLSPMDKAVALCLACYGAGDSDIAPSNATLVEHVGCSESTIGRSLSNLAKCGWIHFEKNTSKYIRSPRRIILDWAIAKDQETKETLVEPGKPRVVWREEEEVVTGDYQGPKKHGF